MLKVGLVAPDDVLADLRRRLSSIEYEIVAAVASLVDLDDVTLDVLVLWEPDADAIDAARQRGLKTVAIGGAEGAHLHVATENAETFKTRVWELFRPS